jgi:hypothetical protein
VSLGAPSLITGGCSIHLRLGEKRDEREDEGREASDFCVKEALPGLSSQRMMASTTAASSLHRDWDWAMAESTDDGWDRATVVAAASTSSLTSRV